MSTQLFHKSELNDSYGDFKLKFEEVCQTVSINCARNGQAATSSYTAVNFEEIG